MPWCSPGWRRPPGSFLADLFERHRIPFGDAPTYTAEQVQRLNDNYTTFTYWDWDRRQLASQHEQLVAGQRERVHLEEALRDSQARVAVRSEEVDHLQAHLASQHEQLVTGQTDRARLEEALRDSQASVAVRSEEVDHLQAHLASKHEQLVTGQTDRARLEEALRDSQARVAVLAEEVDQLQARLASQHEQPVAGQIERTRLEEALHGLSFAERNRTSHQHSPALHASANVIFTICARNYLHFARTLAASLKEAEPSTRFVVFLTDLEPSEDQQLPADLEIVTLDRLEIPNSKDLAFKYDIIEFNTAIKPFCFDYAFDVLRCQTATYLDPDIYVFKSLDHVQHALHAGAACVLTPHTTAPLLDGKKPDDYTFLQVGIYNGGFVALNNTPEARTFNKWWAQKTADDCFVALERGVFVDQKYLDLAPAFMQHVTVLRHPGYNVAYWNLSQRQISRNGEHYKVGGSFDLHFFHFSGVDIHEPDVFSRHQNRFSAEDLNPAAQALYQSYIRQVANNDFFNNVRFSQIPYRFKCLKNGALIDRTVRGVYDRYKRELSKGTDPFSLPVAFFNQPSDQVQRFGTDRVTRFGFELWNIRSDLRGVFDIHAPEGQLGLIAWGATSTTTFALKFSDPQAETALLPALTGQPSTLLADEQTITELSHEWSDPPSEFAPGLLFRALTSKSLLVRNFALRRLLGKARTREYWYRHILANASALSSRSLLLRNFTLRRLLGKARTREYWYRHILANASALSSRSLLVRNFALRRLLGKARTREYWSRHIQANVPANQSAIPHGSDPPSEFASGLLFRALASKSLVVRNFALRRILGKEQTREYWSRQMREIVIVNSQKAVTELNKGLEIYGVLNAETGTGRAARSLAVAISSTDIPFSTHLVELNCFEGKEAFLPGSKAKSGFDTALICLNPDLTIELEKYLPTAQLCKKRKIGHWVWELPIFPAAWIRLSTILTRSGRPASTWPAVCG